MKEGNGCEVRRQQQAKPSKQASPWRDKHPAYKQTYSSLDIVYTYNMRWQLRSLNILVGAGVFPFSLYVLTTYIPTVQLVGSLPFFPHSFLLPFPFFSTHLRTSYASCFLFYIFYFFPFVGISFPQLIVLLWPQLWISTPNLTIDIQTWLKKLQINVYILSCKLTFIWIS